MGCRICVVHNGIFDMSRRVEKKNGIFDMSRGVEKMKKKAGLLNLDAHTSSATSRFRSTPLRIDRF